MPKPAPDHGQVVSSAEEVDGTRVPEGVSADLHLCQARLCQGRLSDMPLDGTQDANASQRCATHAREQRRVGFFRDAAWVIG
jgi:hypothetical protein